MREPIQDPGGALESRDSLTQVRSFAVTTVALKFVWASCFQSQMSSWDRACLLSTFWQVGYMSLAVFLVFQLLSLLAAVVLVRMRSLPAWSRSFQMG